MTSFKLLASIPCGCYACEVSVQPGHCACFTPPEWAVRAEEVGLMARHFDGGTWRWIATPEGDGGNGHVRIPAAWID